MKQKDLTNIAVLFLCNKIVHLLLRGWIKGEKGVKVERVIILKLIFRKKGGGSRVWSAFDEKYIKYPQ